jgi:hypothetical protein
MINVERTTINGIITQKIATNPSVGNSFASHKSKKALPTNAVIDTTDRMDGRR